MIDECVGVSARARVPVCERVFELLRRVADGGDQLDALAYVCDR